MVPRALLLRMKRQAFLQSITSKSAPQIPLWSSAAAFYLYTYMQQWKHVETHLNKDDNNMFMYINIYRSVYIWFFALCVVTCI